MMKKIVNDLMQRMKDQGMSQEDILKKIAEILKQGKKIDLQKKTTCPDTMHFKGKDILKNQKEISKKSKHIIPVTKTNQHDILSQNTHSLSKTHPLSAMILSNGQG
ncbi:MAG: hypothetical protein GKS07_11225 [Nitrosopumilus sp.]|nr:MAG: hypothetical protein GKS07_11225 [Nitrosopumilus sp.]